MLEQFKKLKEEAQNEFMKKVYDSILWLGEKSQQKTYEPTKYEKEKFKEILQILEDVKNVYL